MVQFHHIFMSFITSPFIILSSTIIIIRTIIALSSSNWIFLWAAIELNILRFIPLLINSKKFQETEAAVKYFLAQALGSRIILIRRISIWFYISIPRDFLIIILVISIILKLGIVPCHLWYPSVITSVSWTSCLILSTWQKLAPLIILSFILTPSFTKLIIVVARANALMGGIIGINQTRLRSIIAYSSITHIGWITRLLSIYKPIITTTYFAIYSIIIAPIFIIFQSKSINISTNIRKVILQSPYLQIVIPILILSLAGLPPLTGFIPKWITIYSLSHINSILTIILIIGAIINTYYYINIIFNFTIAHVSNIKSILSNTQIPKFQYSVIGTITLLFLPIIFTI